MLRNPPTFSDISRMLIKLLPLLSFILPVAILYFLDPALFEKTWKGRIFYIFFLWLVSLETILSWDEQEIRKIKKLRSVRTIAFVIALSLPTVYVVAANNYGINALIADVSSRSNIFWASVMPLSTEYLVFTALFILIVMLEYGIRGLKLHSISTFFLGTIGAIYTIDNVYPNGQFTPFQIIVPTTATFAANLLNFLGYQTTWFPPFDGMPDLMVTGSQGSIRFRIAWPCSGVESLLIYSVTILLFLKNSTISWKQRIVYFTFGAAVTYFINILRIATIFIIGINSGGDAARAFHDYYGQLYSITWITLYPLLIIGSRALWGKIRTYATVTEEPMLIR